MEITMRTKNGVFVTDGYHLEQAITKLLPASVNDLRGLWNEMTEPGKDYSDIHYVSEYLVMFAATFPDSVTTPGRPAYQL
jgi:hypothetical protein